MPSIAEHWRTAERVGQIQQKDIIFIPDLAHVQLFPTIITRIREPLARSARMLPPTILTPRAARTLARGYN